MKKCPMCGRSFPDNYVFDLVVTDMAQGFSQQLLCEDCALKDVGFEPPTRQFTQAPGEGRRRQELKTACRSCGTSILQDTFERTGGYCMPCDKKRRQQSLAQVRSAHKRKWWQFWES